MLKSVISFFELWGPARLPECSASLRRFLNSKDKKGIISDYLPWLLIGLAVLAILMVGIFILRGQGISAIDKLKDLFRS